MKNVVLWGNGKPNLNKKVEEILMQCTKTYEYIFSEDEIRQMVVEYFNKNYKEHCPVTKLNVTIEFDKTPYCEPTPKAVVTIEEGI